VSVVLDSSVTLAWLYGDERTEAILSLLDDVAQHGAVVPALWHLEVANGLQVAVRRGRIDDTFRVEALADLAQLDISVDDETHIHAWSATAVLASLTGLTVYDAAYLELAQRRRFPLATLDAALIRVADANGVKVLPSPHSQETT
jgi:predicted nucleic acid-binding protein